MATTAQGALAVGQRQDVEERDRALAAGFQGREDLAVLVLGAAALAEAQQAVGEQQPRLEERGIEVESGAIGRGRLLGPAAEVVEETVQQVTGGLRGVRGEGRVQRPAGGVGTVGRQLLGGGEQDLEGIARQRCRGISGRGGRGGRRG